MHHEYSRSNFCSQAEIVAIVEPNETPSSPMGPWMQSVTELRERYGAPTFESFDALLASDVAKNIDGIVVGAAHHVHHEVITHNTYVVIC
jgi:predicted dehydrogenase